MCGLRSPRTFAQPLRRSNLELRVTTGGRRSQFDELVLPLLGSWGMPVARAGAGVAEWQVLVSQRGAVAVSEEAPAPAEGADEEAEAEEAGAGVAEAMAERRTEAGAGEEVEEEEEEADQEEAEPEQAQVAAGGGAGGRGSRVLVYASSRREAEQLGAYIAAVSDAPTAFYHAGMSSRARRAVELRWRTGALAAVVATVAFGLGAPQPQCAHECPRHPLPAGHALRLHTAAAQYTALPPYLLPSPIHRPTALPSTQAWTWPMWTSWCAGATPTAWRS